MISFINFPVGSQSFYSISSSNGLLKLDTAEKSDSVITFQITSEQREVGYNYSDVLLVYNGNSALSIKIAKYFQSARDIPEVNMVNLTNISAVETVSRTVFSDIRSQIESHLEENNLTYKINYIVTTKGVPLRVSGGGNDRACLDNELTLIKGQYQGYIGNNGWLINPYFEDEEPFSKVKYDLYLVTRLTGFTWPEIKQLIDNATISPRKRGTYVLDVDASKGFTGGYGVGNVWIRDANTILTAKGEPTYYDATNTFVSGISNVIGYASWGSNDGFDTTNFVSNYGFEYSTNHMPNNWYPIYDPGITDNITVNTSDYFSGSQSLRINRTATSSDFTAIAQNITITPEIRYYLRARVNISSISGPGGAHIQVQALDINDKILKVQNTNFRTSVTSTWVSYSQLIYEPVAGAAKVRILAILNQSNGIVYFDHITFNDILPHHYWVPGAIAETFVSTGGRSFTYGTSYGQSLVADLIRDGVTGVKGYVYEPYLSAIAHPDILFDRYTDGYNLAESYYMASNFLGWMDVVVGDPKMAPYDDTLPDLNLSMEGLNFLPVKPNENEEITINYAISNIGNLSAENILVKVYIISGTQESVIDERTITSLGINELVKFNFKYTPEFQGNLSFRVVVDADNMVKEILEDNNIIEKKIYINHAPSPSAISVLQERIYRTEEFTIHCKGSDHESPEYELTPFLEAMHESEGDWFEFQSNQIVYEYNTSSNRWEITVTSNTSMYLGKYSFRISFTDPNDSISIYYYQHRALEVLNNLPILDEIAINLTMINRTESANVTCKASDIENPTHELIVELQYRHKPEDETLESGWLGLGEPIYNDKLNQWWTTITFKASSKLGAYQFRGRVSDNDGNRSSWVYLEPEPIILNNQPKVVNLTIQKEIINRTEKIELIVKGHDVEDNNKLYTMLCELEYAFVDGMVSENLAWEIEYLAAIEFDVGYAAWKTEFVPAAEAVVGNYIFRTRIIDKDSNWSAWFSVDRFLKVLNNPPVAVQSAVPESVQEDQEITVPGKKSNDIENAKSSLDYYWEVRLSEDIKFVNLNDTFVYKFNEDGEYQLNLKVTDLDGAYSWDNKSIIVTNVKPTAKIKINLRSPKVNEIITFSAEESTDTESDIPSLTYNWNFGDDTTGSGMLVNHSYTLPGTYTVTLTVYDNNDAMDIITQRIRIDPSELKTPEKVEESMNDSILYAIILGITMVIILLILLILFLKHKKGIQDQHELPGSRIGSVQVPVPSDFKFHGKELEKVSYGSEAQQKPGVEQPPPLITEPSLAQQPDENLAIDTLPPLEQKQGEVEEAEVIQSENLAPQPKTESLGTTLQQPQLPPVTENIMESITEEETESIDEIPESPERTESSERLEKSEGESRLMRDSDLKPEKSNDDNGNTDEM